MAELAAAGLGVSVVQTLLAALQCTELKKICSIWGYKSELENLKKTVTTIKNVLEDAESKELTKEAHGYVEELKDAVYEADDLFDEFVTLLELKQLQGSLSKGGQFFQKVRSFFSSDKNQVSHAYRMFHKVKKIQKKLHAIADNHQKFTLGVDFKPICMRGEETCSYVNVKDIIGRDDDQRAIIDKLLESRNQDFRFMTIVGVGGLGKTALAQVVYNDEKIRQEFGDSWYWVCVSDQDQQQFDVKAILCKILEVVKRKNHFSACSLETIQNEFREMLVKKKYLLVLDDVWNEDREKWFDLEKLLVLGQGGSRVLVTTRSEMTATIIGDGWTYRLQGLLPEDSWDLFEMTAFKKEYDKKCANHIEMVDIGNRIVEKCNNVPLAIKIVGSLLFGQDISKWGSFEKSALPKIDNGENKIMSVLKLSYYNLRPSLKSCFSYCAVFPKDFRIQKSLVISLWMAQGFIVPLNGDQNIEDAAEEHFSILLRRCFFQDVEKDEYDGVKSFKIHDLMHDVAQQVGCGDIQVMNSASNNFNDKIRHVFIAQGECFESSSNLTNLRSLMNLSFVKLSENTQVVGKWRYLRVLDLKSVEEGCSLQSIGKLQHLRYLDLSYSNFKQLPSSITKLHNLQTLILYYCVNLRELPHDFCKLVKLRHLDLRSCRRLAGMPLGLDKLTGLRVLDTFIVGMKQNVTKKQCDGELQDLQTLTNLTNDIHIFIGKNYRKVEGKEDRSSGGYLSKIPGLIGVSIYFGDECVETEAVVEKLQPHPNVKALSLVSYNGTSIPWCRRADNNWAISLPNLVMLDISYCRNLVYLPSFSKLPFLKSLQLMELKNLEYIEKRSSSADETTDTTFFPSLEFLWIDKLEKLKEWFWEEGLADANYGFETTFRFSCLSKLKIEHCNSLMSFLPCPSVKDVTLNGVYKSRQMMKYIMGKVEQGVEITFGDRTSSSCLTTLSIQSDDELESLSEYESVFETCASSLQNLEIVNCNNLPTISGGLEHLTSLNSLHFFVNKNLKLSENEDEKDMMHWKPLHQSLRSLSFGYLPNMTSLPKGVQYLTSLQSLDLRSCEKLNDLPEWISCLSSLQHLTICGCKTIQSLPQGIQYLTSLQTLTIIDCDSNLEERCREPDGDDWPKIQHIPNIKYKGIW